VSGAGQTVELGQIVACVPHRIDPDVLSLKEPSKKSTPNKKPTPTKKSKRGKTKKTIIKTLIKLKHQHKYITYNKIFSYNFSTCNYSCFLN
jgi:hypothetical protein